MMLLKRCSVVLPDIKLNIFTDAHSLSDMSPLNRLTSEANNKTSNKLVPVDDICSIWQQRKRKNCTKTEKDQNEATDKSKSSDEEEACEQPKKKVWKIVSSDSEEEINEPPKKKVVNVISKYKEEDYSDVSDDDSDYEEESGENSKDSDYEVHKCAVQKEKKEQKKYIPKSQSKTMSAYEKMIEQKRAEKFAFLQSLKIDELKLGLSEAVNHVKKKKKTIKSVKKKEPEPVLPVRKSRRLANLSIDFSEESLYQNALSNAEIQNKIPYTLPSEMTFSEALSSEELYETYVKDVNIKGSKPTEKYYSYDRSALQNLALHDSNIAKVVPERITALAWYPSVDHLIVAAGSKTGNLGIWNVDSESDPHLFKIHTEGSTCLQFNPFNPVQLFSSSYEGILRCGDMEKHIFNEVYNVSDTTSCTYFDFLSATTYLVALKDGQIALLDKRNRKPCEKKHACHNYSVKTINVHPVNKNYFLTAENKGSVRLWDLRKLQEIPVADIKHHKRCLNSAFFSPVTGNSILTTSLDDSVCIFDSTNLTEDIRVTRQKKHNNNTGRWLSIFRATWLPNSDETFVIGNVHDFPRKIHVFDKDMNNYHTLVHDNLTTITSINMFHPYRSALAASNSSGKVFVFT